jgi:hypothetical protein
MWRWSPHTNVQDGIHRSLSALKPGIVAVGRSQNDRRGRRFDLGEANLRVSPTGSEPGGSRRGARCRVVEKSSSARWQARRVERCERRHDPRERVPMIGWKVRRSSSPSRTRDVVADLTISFCARRLGRLLSSCLPTPRPREPLPTVPIRSLPFVGRVSGTDSAGQVVVLLQRCCSRRAGPSE